VDAFIGCEELRGAHPAKHIVFHVELTQKKGKIAVRLLRISKYTLRKHNPAQQLMDKRVTEVVRGDGISKTAFGTCGTTDISNSDLLSLEGDQSYQPGYATSARSYIGVARMVTSLVLTAVQDIYKAKPDLYLDKLVFWLAVHLSSANLLFI
jgi:hypothetical protein